MLTEGRIDDVTDNRNTYVHHEINKPERIRKSSDTLGPLEGEMKENDSETRLTYQGYSDLKRPEKARPKEDVIGLPEGRIDDETENRNTYKGYLPLGKPERHKLPDHLATSTGRLDDRTEVKDNYEPKDVHPLQRVKGRKDTIVRPEGNFEQDTESRNQ